ncbi:MAG: putative alpha-glucosidase [Nitrospira sp.]|nr:MAG: putative alpha-glucosidase [Nitrospira sp.]
MFLIHSDLPWWQSAVIYQIYPWSFQDSNGDGIGDLPGITSRLDYLKGTPDSLGIDAIWLSPIYPSPMHDFGYDVMDYCNIDPRFGSLADFDRLTAEAHRRGIRIVMDLVLNHTSDQHPWFLESRSSRTSAKRDWYYWADGKSAHRPPNNWAARFGGSAWTQDRQTGQYYLHSFLREQPDLNWTNPAVRDAIFGVVRFWLERGVDGFRLDAINWLGKDTNWPNNPCQLAWRSYYRQVHCYDRDQPPAHEALRALRAFVKDRPETVFVGEASSDTPGGPAAFYGTGSDELHEVFDFRLLRSPWQPDAFRRLILESDRAVPLGGWPPVVFSNHDQSRHIDRYGKGGDPVRRARAAALLLFTLRGTPFVYYGEELGLRDGTLGRSDLRDPYTIRYWPWKNGRDPARTPMPWDAEPQAGFTTGKPWLPLSRDWRETNVAHERWDAGSMLSLYKRLIRLKKESNALTAGTYQPVDAGPKECVLYQRIFQAGSRTEAMLIAVNFSSQVQTVSIPTTVPMHGHVGTVTLSTDPKRETERWNAERFQMGPDEGIVVRLE